MGNKWSWINIAVVGGLVFVMAIANAFQFQRPAISKTENRAFATFPKFSAASLKDGSYFAGIDAYVSDTFLGRNTFVELSRAVNYTKDAAKQDKEELTFLKIGDQYNNSVAMKDGKVFFITRWNPEQYARYAEVINQFEQSFDGVPVSVLIAPTQNEMIDHPDAVYQGKTQREVLQEVFQLLNHNIRKVNPVSDMTAHKDEYLYFKTDHHWTALGAYYGYLNFARQNQLNPILIDEIAFENHGDFTGSFLNFTNSGVVSAIKDQLYIYKPEVETDFVFYGNESGKKYSGQLINDEIKGYTAFAGGDYGLSKITTSNKNGQCLLVVKDSYANAMLPYLAEHYEKIVVIDPRYYMHNLALTVKEEGADTVLFINNFETISDENFINCLVRLSQVG